MGSSEVFDEAFGAVVLVDGGDERAVAEPPSSLVPSGVVKQTENDRKEAPPRKLSRCNAEAESPEVDSENGRGR